MTEPNHPAADGSTGAAHSPAAQIQCPNPSCRAANPVGKKFCGDCGSSLAASPEQQLEWQIAKQVQEALDSRCKDQKLLELETAEAVLNRVWGWAKVIGAVVSISGVILVASLTVFGIKSYDDFSAKVHSSQKSVDDKVQAFDSDLGRWRTRLASVDDEFKRMEGILKTANEKIGETDIRLRRVEANLAKPVPKDLEQRLEAMLRPYRQYLAAIGFGAARDKVPLYIARRGFAESSDDSNLSYELPNEAFPLGRIIIGEKLTHADDAILREFTHFVMYHSGSPGPALAQSLSTGVESLDSALADYFPCSFLRNPILGREVAAALRSQGKFDGDFLRNLDNRRKLTELSSGPEIHEGGEIIGGTLWEIREVLNQDVADHLFCAGWQKMVLKDEQGDAMAAVRAYFRHVVEAAGRAEGDKIRSVLQGRGLELGEGPLPATRPGPTTEPSH